MLRLIDRAFGALLVLGAAGHAFGSFSLIPAGTDLRVWSLGSALCAALLGVLNLLRAGRDNDLPLAVICFFGSLGWLVIAAMFGQFLGNFSDFRVVWHGICALVLAAFSIRTILAAKA